jgi:o-succinylbenzoate synthase
MNFEITIEKRQLVFKKPAGTSRGFLQEKPSYFIDLWHKENPNQKGKGEASLILGLNPETEADIETFLPKLQSNLDFYLDNLQLLQKMPSLRFALEMAKLDWANGAVQIWYPNDFVKGLQKIQINGLVWMANPEEMLLEARNKAKSGFTCIKFKIGALDFQAEHQIIAQIRREFPNLAVRLDANGAFDANFYLHKILPLYAPLRIHSIEQPIAKGNWQEMGEVRKKSSIPIALDEELIGLSEQEITNCLDEIQPQYVVLKPSLLGGFHACERIIALAEKRGIQYWITSALESNLALEAIAQFTANLNPSLPQGLGTGELYQNNVETFLQLDGDRLTVKPKTR